MLKKEYERLQDGDVVKLRGTGSARGPVVAFIEDKQQVQFAYPENNGHISLATLPYACLDLVEKHPTEEASVSPGTRTRTRQGR